MADQERLFKRGGKLNSIQEIQDKVYEIGATINAPADFLHIQNKSNGDGTPHIKVTNHSYEYIIEERGCIVESRKTDDLNLLLYWIMHDVIFKMASEYELANREKMSDSRRILFAKEVELFSKIDPYWAQKKADEINAILASNPYSN